MTKRTILLGIGLAFLVGGCGTRITGVTDISVEGSAAPFGIACDNNSGDIWYSEPRAGMIVKRLRDGTSIRYQVKDSTDDPTYLTLTFRRAGTGAWFTAPHANKIGRITLDGTVEEFPLPNRISGPLEIDDDANGGAWFTEYSGNRIGHIGVDGKIVEYPIPTRNSGPYGIAKANSDDTMWFTERDGNKIGRIDTAGKIVEYRLKRPNSRPTGIVPEYWGYAPGMWIAESGSGNVARVGQDGRVSEQRVSGSPAIVETGYEGTIWYADPQEPRIGHFEGEQPNDRSEQMRNIGGIGDMIFCPFYNSLWLTDPVLKKIDNISVYTQSYT